MKKKELFCSENKSFFTILVRSPRKAKRKPANNKKKKTQKVMKNQSNVPTKVKRLLRMNLKQLRKTRRLRTARSQPANRKRMIPKMMKSLQNAAPLIKRNLKMKKNLSVAANVEIVSKP